MLSSESRRFRDELIMTKINRIKQYQSRVIEVDGILMDLSGGGRRKKEESGKVVGKVA